MTVYGNNTSHLNQQENTAFLLHTMNEKKLLCKPQRIKPFIQKNAKSYETATNKSIPT